MKTIDFSFIMLYFIALTLIGFVQMALDKRYSKTRKRRISERTLLFTAIAGGALGAFLAMHLLGHKTRKGVFRWGLPLIVLIWTGYLLYYSQL